MSLRADLIRLRRKRARHECEMFKLASQIRDLEIKVQDEDGLCACWLPNGDARCLCGVLGRRRAVPKIANAAMTFSSGIPRPLT